MQPDLLGAAHHPAEVHRLFFALMPDAPTRERLAAAARTLEATHPALHARWVRPGRYHATLHFLGDHPQLREDLVAAAMSVGDTLRAEAFDWTLDQVASFRARQPPCVLRGAVEPAPLRALWETSRRALALAGLGAHLDGRFVPHVTVAYSRGVVLEPEAMAPVHWRVDRLALIDSVVGRPDYRVLGAWRLAG